ncbi:MAG TPA: preprotein translocase subunit YajC [Bacteroidetes bacterium]|nr:preprotein translocase subunit YajC [Bacteroidota bacterium]
MSSLFMVLFFQAGEPQADPFRMFLPIILIFVVMYFFMIRPQVKKQKKHQEMVQSLQKGDKVLTSGGIYGQVVGIKENAFVVKIADNTKVEVAKSAIGQKLES